MNFYRTIAVISMIASIVLSCSKTDNKADGYGNFEATEITISAENNGKLMQFSVNEGDQLARDAILGYIDTIALSLKRAQLLATKEVIASKSKGVLSQISVLQARKKTANTNLNRIRAMLKENAATQKQLDDATGEIDIITQQIRSIEIQNAPVVNELKHIDLQIKQVEDQLHKSIIVNPINGTVLTKYAEPNELTSFGKPLYKIADLSTMELRTYVSETQLANLRIGQEVTVKIDEGQSTKSYAGKIIWISSEAEFTPKIIQTKEERVALVYALKVQVQNDGSLKIGMPAEIWFNKDNQP